MYINNLLLADFRNIAMAEIKLNNGINILYGDNAQGKTNILEAVYICATGRSHRTKIDGQLINFGKREAHIKAFIVRDRRTDRIDVHLKKDEKKGIAINGVPIRKSGDLFGTLHTVMFSPEDLQLIKNAPSERRRFIDMELCQLSNIYYYDLQQYYKVLKQRNNLLKRIQKNSKLRDTLFPWNSQMCQYGIRVIDSRKAFIERLNTISSKIHKGITDGTEELFIEYKPNVLSCDFDNKLEALTEKDIIYGSTTAGPHKDDIIFYVNQNDVKIFGSQGQQRTAALSAKLAEIEIIKCETGQTPVLLLDDVLSELDERRQYYLLDSIRDTQTIITCTGIEDSIKKYIDRAFVFNIKDGIVEQRHTLI
ncbi:MAG TPA: DNA replication/repair protein RecF [Lachnospiraceae bacterium]|nr:DNA replication/repair protein RecF [Lachnospiraceae bacterium]